MPLEFQTYISRLWFKFSTYVPSFAGVGKISILLPELEAFNSHQTYKNQLSIWKQANYLHAPCIRKRNGPDYICYAALQASQSSCFGAGKLKPYFVPVGQSRAAKKQTNLT